jgi:hypothetical protein
MIMSPKEHLSVGSLHQTKYSINTARALLRNSTNERHEQ